MKWRLVANGAAVVLVLSCTPSSQQVGASTSAVFNNAEPTNPALLELSRITVAKEHRSGYKRSLFPHWKDLDGDGCNTREEVLIRDSVTRAQVDPFGCIVMAGDWVSPYDGARWSDRGEIDIDHVVALKEAWDSGAWAWTTAQRMAFANDLTDPRTLLAVTDSVNQKKSDKDPSNWLPPLTSYHCTYLTNWVSIKARWKLTMDSSEFGRVRKILKSCPVGVTTTTTPTTTLTTTLTTNQTTTQTTNTANVTENPPVGVARPRLVSPGAWCSPLGGLGASKSGISYVCANTSATGTPYKDGRARWRQGP